MELGNQPLYDSKHCEASAGGTTEANLCYDFEHFIVHKSNTAAKSASRRAAWHPNPNV